MFADGISLTVVFLAVALSMDAFAVALAIGLKLCFTTTRQSFRLAFHFGLFQFAMPVIGWYVGCSLYGYISSWAHWLAFFILLGLGANMIRQSFQEEDAVECPDPTKGFSLIMLSVATSIDALAVGVSLAVLKQPIWQSSVIIGVCCALITYIGLKMGAYAGQYMRMGSRAAFLGGVVLILIGCNFVWEYYAAKL